MGFKFCREGKGNSLSKGGVSIAQDNFLQPT